MTERNYGLGEAAGEDPWMTVHRLQDELSAAEARIAELEGALAIALPNLGPQTRRKVDAALHPKEDTDGA